jgi:hypothetical protein
VKRVPKARGGVRTRRTLTEQALLEAYKPLADSYVMSFAGCSTPGQIDDMIMSNPEELLPLVMGIGGFPGGASNDAREFLELPRLRRFLGALAGRTGASCALRTTPTQSVDFIRQRAPQRRILQETPDP